MRKSQTTNTNCLRAKSERDCRVSDTFGNPIHNTTFMYVKLGNNVINLDLIREIGDVQGVLCNKKSDYRDYRDMSEKDTEYWEEVSVNGDKGQREYTVEYAFPIYYIGEKYAKWVDHTDKEKVTVAREQLCVLLNGNKPLMKVIL